jgi:hypothetical protein
MLLDYQCNNCETARFYVLLAIHSRRHLPVGPLTIAVEKVGQWPKMEVRAPKLLEQALGTHVSVYRRALTSRHQGYGIGAVAYLRRIVEETIDTLLDLVAEVLKLESGNEGQVARLEEAKKGKVFDEKVKLAGDALPAHLRPGGINPFGTLHDLLSSGIHRLSEERALAVADAVIESLGYLFTELDVHVRARRAFVEKMKGLEKLRQAPQ